MEEKRVEKQVTISPEFRQELGRGRGATCKSRNQTLARSGAVAGLRKKCWQQDWQRSWRLPGQKAVLDK